MTCDMLKGDMDVYGDGYEYSRYFLNYFRQKALFVFLFD